MNVIFFTLMLACKKQQPPEPVVEPPPQNIPAAPSQLPEQIITMTQNFQRVYFDTDSSTLNLQAKEALEENAQLMLKHTDIRIEIQGHADERGTTDYNLALGQQRATSVSEYLINLGVPSNRIRMTSFGEEKPLSVTSSEHAWSQNRRCEFVIVWSKSKYIQGSME